MSKYLQIQIPNACHENWDKMDTAQQGRFCNSCQKSVIDFTLMSDNDLVNFFKKNTGNVCGRFYDNQLNTDLLIPGKKIPWLKYFFHVAIPAMLFSTKATAQGTVRVIEKHIVDKKSVKSQLPLIVTEPKGDIQKIPTKQNLSLLNDEGYTSSCTRIRLGGAMSYVRIVPERKFFSLFRMQNSKYSFSVFPNPITPNSKLNIKWKDNISSDQLIEIFTQTGNLVQQETIRTNKKLNQESFYVKQLPAGIYIIKITDSKTHKFSSQQFIVQ